MLVVCVCVHTLHVYVFIFMVMFWGFASERWIFGGGTIQVVTYEHRNKLWFNVFMFIDFLFLLHYYLFWIKWVWIWWKDIGFGFMFNSHLSFLIGEQESPSHLFLPKILPRFIIPLFSFFYLWYFLCTFIYLYFELCNI